MNAAFASALSASVTSFESEKILSLPVIFSNVEMTLQSVEGQKYSAILRIDHVMCNVVRLSVEILPTAVISIC